MVKLNKVNVAALIATGAILLGIVAVFLFLPGSKAMEGAYEAVVHDGDGNEYVLPLSEDAVLPVESSLGSNTIEVADGAVFVRDADCDTLDCVHQGAINSPGPQIICLPHKLWIEVVSSGQRDGSATMDVNAVQGEADYDTLAR